MAAFSEHLEDENWLWQKKGGQIQALRLKKDGTPVAALFHFTANRLGGSGIFH
jgi:hypothetical protein